MGDPRCVIKLCVPPDKLYLDKHHSRFDSVHLLQRHSSSIDPGLSRTIHTKLSYTWAITIIMLLKNFLIISAFALLSGTHAAEGVSDGDTPKLNVGSLNLHKRDTPNGLHARNPALLENLEGLVLAGSSTPTATPAASPSSFSHKAQTRPRPTQAPRRQKRNPGLLSEVGSIIPGLEQTSSTHASSAAPSNFNSHHGKPSQHSKSLDRRALATPTSTPSSFSVQHPRVSSTPTPRPSMMRRVKLT